MYGEVGMGRIAVISDSMHDCNMYATVEERMKSNIYRFIINTNSCIYLMLFFLSMYFYPSSDLSPSDSIVSMMTGLWANYLVSMELGLRIDCCAWYYALVLLVYRFLKQ